MSKMTHDPRKIREKLGVAQTELLSPKNPKPVVIAGSLMDCLTHGDMFTPEECAAIIKDNSPEEWEEAGMWLDGKKTIDHSYRHTENCFIEKNEDTLWLFDKVLAIVMSANQHKWHFEIDFFEAIQLAKYEEGMHYDWHMDLGPATAGNRKISMSVQLSADDDYEGGNLVLDLGENGFDAPREIGSVTVFPSFMKHKVEPVTKGTRYSLVVWCSGTNRFR